MTGQIYIQYEGENQIKSVNGTSRKVNGRFGRLSVFY